MARYLKNRDLLGSTGKIVFLFLVLAFWNLNRVQAEERNLWIKVGAAVSFIDIVPNDENKTPVEDTASLSPNDFENSQPVIEVSGSYYPLGCFRNETDPEAGETCLLGLAVRFHAGHYRLKGRWLDLDSTTDTSSSSTEFYYRNTKFGGEMDLGFGMILNGYSVFSVGVRGSINDYDFLIFGNQGDLLVDERGKRAVSMSWTVGLNILPVLFYIVFEGVDTYPFVLHYTYEKTFENWNRIDVADINSSNGGRMLVDMRQSTHTLSILYGF